MLNPILQSYVNDFLLDSGLPKLTGSVAFEHFVNYSVVARAQPEKFDLEELEAVRVAGTGDLGIDGIAILVNDHVVRLSEEVDYFAKQFRRWDVEFVFTQAKTSPHFRCDEIGRFLDGVRTFFQEQLPTTANDVLRERHAVKQHIIAGFERMEEAPVCRLFYAAPGEWSTTDQNLATTVTNGKENLKATGLFRDVLFVPLDEEAGGAAPQSATSPVRKAHHSS